MNTLTTGQRALLRLMVEQARIADLDIGVSWNVLATLLDAERDLGAAQQSITELEAAFRDNPPIMSKEWVTLPATEYDALVARIAALEAEGPWMYEAKAFILYIAHARPMRINEHLEANARALAATCPITATPTPEDIQGVLVADQTGSVDGVGLDGIDTSAEVFGSDAGQVGERRRKP